MSFLFSPRNVAKLFLKKHFQSTEQKFLTTKIVQVIVQQNTIKIFQVKTELLTWKMIKMSFQKGFDSNVVVRNISGIEL